MPDDLPGPTPPAPPARTLLVKLTHGAEALERANQAFTVAATAVTAGVGVSLWLTGDAVRFATPGHAESLDLPHATPLADLRDAVLAGGTVTVCSQCAVRRELTEFLPGVRLAGAASFVEEAVAPATQALVY